MRTIFSLLLFCGLFSACQPADNASVTTETAAATSRIISLGGTLTEILYDLGYGDQLVGVDVTSTYPVAVNATPKVGHVSQLNVEGLLALQPTLVFVDADNADKPALKTLATAGVTVVPVKMATTLDNAALVAKQLAAYLPISAESLSAYQRKVAGELASFSDLLTTKPATPARVLFLYARSAKQIMVAGTGTEAAAMIEIAGGKNAVNAFPGFKPLTPEALVEAAPDVILMLHSGLEKLDGKAGLANIPGMDQTPAFQNDNIIAMDGQYLLGFGPRAAQAARELSQNLYPPAVK